MAKRAATEEQADGDGGLRDFGGAAYESFAFEDSQSPTEPPKPVGMKRYGIAQHFGKGPKGDVYTGQPIGEVQVLHFIVPNNE